MKGASANIRVSMNDGGSDGYVSARGKCDLPSLEDYNSVFRLCNLLGDMDDWWHQAKFVRSESSNDSAK